jgi:hypothetical protein
MHIGGALVNHTTRVADPVAGGQVGTTTLVVNGWVVGVLNVVVVVDPLDVVVVVDPLTDFDPAPLTSSTMPTIMAAKITAPIPRRVNRRRFLLLSMTACFCARAARCRSLLSVGTERKATEPTGCHALARREWA